MNKTVIQGVITGGCMLLVILFLTGCTGIHKDFPEKNLFRIDPPRPVTISPGLEMGKGLLVRQFDISPEFETNFFMYQVSQDRFTGDYYNKFMVSPARMITDAVKEALYNSAFFRPVPASEPSDIFFRLSGKIIQLYGDHTNPAHPRAVMTLRLILEEQTDKGFIPVINQVYAAFEPTSQNRPAALVQAWNRCLENILTDFFRNVDTLD
ncbi:MAG: ABC transporter [Desulfotignum sp.]|nr:ABC transporter [Desulfobacteraceae bacterium]